MLDVESIFVAAVQSVAQTKAQKAQKDPLPQSVFTLPPELDVSLVLEFVGSVQFLLSCTQIYCCLS